MSSLPIPAYIAGPWDTELNQALAPQATAILTNQHNTRTEIDELISMGATVIGSSNSVAGALDGVNRWVIDTNCVWANNGTAHSWIVLELANGVQILFDLSPASAQGAARRVSYSSAGFTGGSNTNRPTATDERVVFASTNWFLTTAGTYVRHQWMSDDGADYRCIYAASGALFNAFLFGAPENPPTGWDDETPAWGYGGTGATCLDYTVIWSTAAAVAKVEGIDAAVYLGSQGFGGTFAGNSLNTFGVDDAWPFWGVGLASATALVHSTLGAARDLYYAVHAAPLGQLAPAKTVGPPPVTEWTWVKVGGLYMPTPNVELEWAA